ncbi:MAG: hypothetical protein E7384_03035 [Ruminococcaceae bacterium]|nr:hypothetical protein [Oscillospiraceae bacterium]
MKKVLTLFLVFTLMFSLSGCVAEGIAMFYSESVEKDNFYIAINKTANCCFVGAYECTEYVENLEITIPDEYNNMPVKRIGGYFGTGVPSPFRISLEELYMNAPEGSEYHGFYSGNISRFEIKDDYHIEELVFNLNIGKNIEVIHFVISDEYFPHINDDGSVTFYHPVVNINCSEENDCFYSKDGKLYDRKTDELITEFDYAE